MAGHRPSFSYERSELEKLVLAERSEAASEASACGPSSFVPIGNWMARMKRAMTIK